MSLLLNEYWLEFDGVDDYVQAQNLGDLEYATSAMMDIELDIATPQYLMGNASYLGTDANRVASWYFRVHDGTIGVSTWNNAGNPATSATTTPVPTAQRIKLEYQSDGTTLDLLIDGVVVDSVPHTNIPTGSSPNKFQVGQAPAGTTSARLKGKLYSFQVGTETFTLNEGTGTTITGSEGTVLDIYGATWGGQPNKKIKDVYIEDSGILKPVKYIFLGTSTGLKTVYQSEPTP